MGLCLSPPTGLRNKCIYLLTVARCFIRRQKTFPFATWEVVRLDITLPVATADYIDFSENRAYLSPRFWVDLIQRQTGKLRWQPFPRAGVVFDRYDCFTIREDHLYGGVKGLLDALKVRTTGRRDRLYLHYFGAIADDGPTFIDLLCRQSLVVHPKDARVRLQVLPKKTVTMERKLRASAARSRRST